MAATAWHANYPSRVSTFAARTHLHSLTLTPEKELAFFMPIPSRGIRRHRDTRTRRYRELPIPYCPFPIPYPPFPFPIPQLRV
ncbi:hypothetical protein PN466_23990 [Roseofilum reptotaenium CS-1145]|uniref:hypothetical protein n=1 Tax=Roseofilum TaxID=1233426 RepID=UPI000B26EAC3|nr:MULTISPECIES: hypothetical protein [Roseofilum]MBP0028520.1 hypothetical protein [Roseofilum sp. Guam]MDB9520011.1 hypothetical protein [Roseofilum reptotaenium CS-1145]